MKKIISFSVWGDKENYLNGAFRNIMLARSFYPGWIPRFYHCGLSSEYVKKLQDMGAETIEKQFYKDAWFGLYWRFCPMYDDPEIERFIVRDTDARLSGREADAVEQWEESGKSFHIMRDNAAHNVPILGGMWGSIPGIIPDFADKIRGWMHTIQGCVDNPRGRYHDTDQQFLWNVVWPVVKNNHIAHGIHLFGGELPFRVINSDGYKVGT